MTVAFAQATKHAAKLRLALDGPAGSGKTFTALTIATALADKVAVVDTEHGSASKYADLFAFSVLELDSFHPERFVEAIDAAEEAGFGALVIDSLSHAWMGKDGTLELVDRAAKRSQSGNSFTAWKDVTPIQNALVERILAARLHIIATLRVKTEYIIQVNDKGRQEPKRVGMAPAQRDQVEYEFDVYGHLDQDNTLVISKSRCVALSNAVIRKPGAELAASLNEWLTNGPAPAARPAAAEVREPRVETDRKIDSHDDELMQKYAGLTERATEVGVPFEVVSPPITEGALRIIADKLKAAIKAAKAGK